MHCRYGGQCGGCPLIALDPDQQKSLKLQDFISNWKALDLGNLPELNFVEIAESGLRDRADMTWHVQDGRSRLGLYDFEKKEILDLESCPQMSSSLAAFFAEIRNIKFPVNLGSLRFRVGPTGKKGLWLDFSHLNVKSLFDEKETLKKLMEISVVEIGQRRKRLYFDSERPRLGDPQLEEWFETYLGPELRPQSLKCSIADFTQPSMQANKVLVRELYHMLGSLSLRRLFEFGSGIGNFTLPLAHMCEQLEVFERDKSSLYSLEVNLKNAGLDSRVSIHRGDFQRIKNKKAPEFWRADAVFVDPPRSGLGEFLNVMEDEPGNKRPEHFIYVSCFAKSFCQDAKQLRALGYRPLRLSLVDQFPQSHHYEIMAHFVQE